MSNLLWAKAGTKCIPDEIADQLSYALGDAKMTKLYEDQAEYLGVKTKALSEQNIPETRNTQLLKSPKNLKHC
jgi:hypothetical protein